MATKIQILSNTNYPLADVLKSELIESSAVKIAVAFLRKSGLDVIHKSLNYALTENNATVEIIVGLDFKTTDDKALLALKDVENSSKNFTFYCFGDKKDNYNDLIFHPKIYLFNKLSSKQTNFTSIIGSSNLTGGGLTSNFEVNSVIREDKPVYYSQVLSIYDEIKYKDSIFRPNMDYIRKYGEIKKELEKSENITDSNIQKEIKLLCNEEENLPGTVPSLKKVIIEFMAQQEKNGIKEISLEEMYKIIPVMTEERHMNMKMDTINNSIRGELNKHELASTHKDGKQLFKRIGRGFYTLTDKAKTYKGR